MLCFSYLLDPERHITDISPSISVKNIALRVQFYKIYLENNRVQKIVIERYSNLIIVKTDISNSDRILYSI